MKPAIAVSAFPVAIPALDLQALHFSINKPIREILQEKTLKKVLESVFNLQYPTFDSRQPMNMFNFVLETTWQS